jgi:multidrug resistance protein MdtO
MTASAWIATSGPRLSYSGVQIAVAFCLINLQEFKMQTSLAVARDRVAGIFLGLIVMWLVFDQLWGAPAAIEMKKTFVSVLRSLAEFAREPHSNDLKIAIARSYSLRETVTNASDKVRALADGILFEFGPSRERDLVLRSQILRWQPQLRMVFVTRIALLKYRLNLPGFELPKEVRVAQQEFDEQLAQMLDGMADRLEGKASQRDRSMDASFERLEKAAQIYSSEERREMFAAQMQTFLALSRRIEDLATSLDRDI